MTTMNSSRIMGTTGPGVGWLGWLVLVVGTYQGSAKAGLGTWLSTKIVVASSSTPWKLEDLTLVALGRQGALHEMVLSAVHTTYLSTWVSG